MHNVTICKGCLPINQVYMDASSVRIMAVVDTVQHCTANIVSFSLTSLAPVLALFVQFSFLHCLYKIIVTLNFVNVLLGLIISKSIQSHVVLLGVRDLAKNPRLKMILKIFKRCTNTLITRILRARIKFFLNLKCANY